MRGLLLGLLCQLCLLSLAGAATPTETPVDEAAKLTVRYEQGLLTVEAKEVEAGRLLQEVARQSGITLELANPSPTPVTLSFTQEPLEEGLHRIMRALQNLEHVSYLLSYDAAAHVTQLQVFPAQAADPWNSAPPPLPQDLSKYEDISVTPMEAKQPPPDFDRVIPMKDAQPLPEFGDMPPMEQAQPVPGEGLLPPLPAAPPRR